ncbi:MAG: diguanylate cyclase [Magnetococcus sp. YQC-3]
MKKTAKQANNFLTRSDATRWEPEAAALLLETTQSGAYRLDVAGHIQWVNPMAAHLLGREASELLGKAPHALFHYHHANGTPYPEAGCLLCSNAHRNAHQAHYEFFWHKDGTGFPVEYTRMPIAHEGSVQGSLVVFRDITQQRQQEKKELDSIASRIAISALLETSIEPISLRRQMEVALEIILSVPWLSIQFKGSIAILDEASGTLVTQASMGLDERLLTLCKKIPMGHCLCGLAAQTRQTIFANQLDERHHIRFPDMEEHGHYCLPILSRSRLLGVLNCYIPAGALYQPEEEAFLATAANTLSGIIERRQLESQLLKTQEQLAHAATHDGMTNLPNKALFLEHLARSVALARRDKERMALLFIDLDRFKQVNDTFGHEVGDLLLIEVARRIKEALRESDLVARLGGDEFTAILRQIKTEEDATLVARKIIDQLQSPFHLKGHVCLIGSSIGISLFPEHGETADLLIRHADIAMYAVKQSGRNNFALFKHSQVGPT